MVKIYTIIKSLSGLLALGMILSLVGQSALAQAPSPYTSSCSITLGNAFDIQAPSISVGSGGTVTKSKTANKITNCTATAMYARATLTISVTIPSSCSYSTFCSPRTSVSLYRRFWSKRIAPAGSRGFTSANFVRTIGANNECVSNATSESSWTNRCDLNESDLPDKILMLGVYLR